MTNLTERLLECMNEKNIGIKKTSMLTGISRNRIRQIIHGATDLKINEAAKLQTAFGIDALEWASLCGKDAWDKGDVYIKNGDVYEKAEVKAELPDVKFTDGRFDFPGLDRKDIDHPARYGGDTDYECIKVLKAWLNADEYRGFLRGNAIKYLCRLGKKDDCVKELGKSKWYIDKLRESYEKNNEKEKYKEEIE